MRTDDVVTALIDGRRVDLKLDAHITPDRTVGQHDEGFLASDPDDDEGSYFVSSNDSTVYAWEPRTHAFDQPVGDVVSVSTGREPIVNSHTILDEQSPEMRVALHDALCGIFNKETLSVAPYHTGGGIWVLEADLSLDGRGIGRRIWLTREDHWYLGFYNDREVPDGYDNEGVVVQLLCDPTSAHDVAYAVAGILVRLGVKTLEGE